MGGFPPRMKRSPRRRARRTQSPSSSGCTTATTACLSEEGGNLSQGQRQLLSIARAILADPAVLILDEATSSVDTRTELHIQQAMLRLMRGRTSFVIAHRLSTIQDADEILVIDAGRIVERGTHRELLEAGGFYWRLYSTQFDRTGTVQK